MQWSDPLVPSPMMLFAVAVVAALISALGTVWAIAHAHRRGLLDQPGERRSHDLPTPRGGGIGIVLACVATLLLLAGTGSNPGSWLLVATGLLMTAAIGWWDDHRPLPVWPRLLVHSVAAICLAWALQLQGAGPLVVVSALVVTLVLVNAWNFMDGINGLASSQALLCALGFAAVLGDEWRIAALALAGACAGFLPFNFPRARIFLGDIGSGSLGYLVAALLAAGFATRPTGTWPLLLLPPMAMLADTGYTLLWRMRRGERWWHAHVDHAYQRWSRSQGHLRVALGYAGCTIVAIMVMLALIPAGHGWGIGTATAMLLACWAAWWRSR